MFKKFQLSAVAFLVVILCSSATRSQVAGDYGSAGTDNWGTITNWLVFVSASDWSDATVATAVPNNTKNVWIRPGHTVTMEASSKVCKTLTIQSGGTLLTSATGNTLTVSGDARIDGTMGSVTAAPLFQFGATGKIFGSGTCYVSKIRPNAAGLTMTVDMNVTVVSAASSVINCNVKNDIVFEIKAGRSVTLPTGGYVSVASNSSTSDPGAGQNFTINVYGTLTAPIATGGGISLANLTGFTTTLNVYGGGIVNTGRLSAIAAGTADAGAIHVNVNSGGTIALTRPITNDITKAIIAIDGVFDCDSAIATTNLGTSTVSSTGKLRLQSGTYPSGTITLNAGSTVEYYGTNAITMPATPTTYSNLTINNASGVTLSGPTAVNGTLALTNGNLNLNGNTLTYGSLTGTSGNVSQTVPLNAPSAVDVGGLGAVISSSADLGSTTVTRGVFPQGGSAPGIKRWYDIVPTNNSGLNATLVFHYDESELNGNLEANLGLFKSLDGGTTWAFQGGTLDQTANTLTITGINDFSRWTAANSDSPLPIQLASFTGTVLGTHSVRLDWVTLSELNNYGFYVQKKPLGGSGWNEIPASFTSGHGTTNVPQYYSFTDAAAAGGALQYRLKQIDLDGSVHFTDPVEVEVLTSVAEAAPREFSLLQNYPNPFNPSTEIKFSVAAPGRAVLDVYNTLGQRVATLFDGLAEVGQYYSVRFAGGNLTSGVYFYRLQSGAKSELKKFMLLK